MEGPANPYTPRATVAVCDMRGRPQGEPVERAKVLDKAEAADVQRAITSDTGYSAPCSTHTASRAGTPRSIGIELKAA